MIKRWSLFNESKNTNILSLDTIDDSFTINDIDKFELHYFILSNNRNEWISLRDSEFEEASRVGYGVSIENSIGLIDSIASLSKKISLLKSIESICKRAIKYDNVLCVHFDITEYSISVIFEIKPTMYDACYISYNYVKSYFDFDMLFSSNDDGYYITCIDNSKDVNEFSKKFKDVISEDFTKSKWDSIEEKDGKYIIKNFISIEDIKFKF